REAAAALRDGTGYPKPARRAWVTVCRSRSPDRHALVMRQMQIVTLGHTERLVEGVDVADDLVAPELVRRVRVDREQPDRLRFAALLLPDLGPAQQQSLHAGQPVDDRGLGTAERELIGLQRDAETAEVADVLADGQRAVDVVLRVEA